MTRPRLPPETTDSVIAYVCPDTRTLLSCALVCKNWLPASRIHLFHHVRLTSPDSLGQYDALVSRVLHSDALKWHLSSVRTLELLAPRSLRYGRQTRNWGMSLDGVFDVSGHYEEQQLELKLRDQSRFRFFAHDFAGQLPNLTELVLGGSVVWDTHSPHPSAFLAFSAFPSISVLELYECRLPSFASLRRALVALPFLTGLSMEEVQWPTTVHSTPAGHSGRNTLMRRPRLSWLSLSDKHGGPALWPRSPIHQFLCWVVTTSSMKSLRKFALSMLDGEGLHNYVNYFKGCAVLQPLCPLVSTLHISLPHDPVSEGLSQNVQVHFPNLSRMTLWVHFSQWDVIVLALRNLEVPATVRVRSLRMDVKIMFGLDDNSEPLSGAAALDSVLDGALFDNLRDVKIRIQRYVCDGAKERCVLSQQEVIEAVQCALPKLMARNVTIIEVYEHHIRM